MVTADVTAAVRLRVSGRRHAGERPWVCFGALTTAVTGMRAQSFALENISGNIANSQTTAFKRIDTTFEDLIPDDIPSQQLAGSVIGEVALDQHRAGRHPERPRSAPSWRSTATAFSSSRSRQASSTTGRCSTAPTSTRGAATSSRQERLSRQRRRLLSDGHSDRPDHRQPGRQRAAAAAVPERFPAGAGDDARSTIAPTSRAIR